MNTVELGSESTANRRGMRGIASIAIALLFGSTLALGAVQPSAALTWNCPVNAPFGYRLLIDDVVLQREADKIGVCGDGASTFLVINNSSSQPISFWSTGFASTWRLITGTASAATRAQNTAVRDLLMSTGSSGNFVLAGESMRVDLSPAQFAWDFDTGLTTTTLAADVAGGLAFGKAKKWASAGSNKRAAVVTCASGAIAAGATAESVDDVLKGLLLGATPCAAAVERAQAVATDEKTLVQRAARLQSTITSVDSFVDNIDLAVVIGKVLRRGH
ncbi:hypothetical protein [Agromyces sp. NPDC057865]|uniref:hypothetical protein n=1 Tax=Agromyces sp. NPDC057865 TaxID=3346267 RepID=UPI00366A98B5